MLILFCLELEAIIMDSEMTSKFGKQTIKESRIGEYLPIMDLDLYINWIKMKKLGQMIIIIGQSDCQDVGHRFGKLLRVKSKENSFKKLELIYTNPA
jgi:hypothetical protein